MIILHKIRLFMHWQGCLPLLACVGSGRSGKAVRDFIPINRPDKTPEQRNEEYTRGCNFISFVDSSPEPFHCVDTVVKSLNDQGFLELHENKPWRAMSSIRTGGKYYFTRNKSSIVALIVGQVCAILATGVVNYFFKAYTVTIVEF